MVPDWAFLATAYITLYSHTAFVHNVCHNPQDRNLNTYQLENLKTYVYIPAVIFPQGLIIFDTNPQTLLEVNFACKKYQTEQVSETEYQKGSARCSCSVCLTYVHDSSSSGWLSWYSHFTAITNFSSLCSSFISFLFFSLLPFSLRHFFITVFA